MKEVKELRDKIKARDKVINNQIKIINNLLKALEVLITKQIRRLNDY